MEGEPTDLGVGQARRGQPRRPGVRRAPDPDQVAADEEVAGAVGVDGHVGDASTDPGLAERRPLEGGDVGHGGFPRRGRHGGCG
ncbi:MAG: hypothetical protein GEV08_00645 [Acidimicrobiia bacterium]|nr:hypothetical protein [Acidimicrobiia bacterium]